LCHHQIKDCGLQQQLGFIQQEAGALGVANITRSLAGAVAVLVHGADFYPDLYSVLQLAEAHDYRGAGQALQKVMSELYQWTQGHACTADYCYVAVGALEFLGNVAGDFRLCTQVCRLLHVFHQG
jgi:hypothetical protein